MEDEVDSEDDDHISKMDIPGVLPVPIFSPGLSDLEDNTDYDTDDDSDDSSYDYQTPVAWLPVADLSLGWSDPPTAKAKSKGRKANKERKFSLCLEVVSSRVSSGLEKAMDTHIQQNHWHTIEVIDKGMSIL